MSSEKLGVRDGSEKRGWLIANPGAWRGWHLGKLGRSKQRPYRGSREGAAKRKRRAGPARARPAPVARDGVEPTPNRRLEVARSIWRSGSVLGFWA